MNSVKKTHRVISAEEGWPQSGVGAEIIAMINEEAFVSLPHLQCTDATKVAALACGLQCCRLPGTM